MDERENLDLFVLFSIIHLNINVELAFHYIASITLLPNSSNDILDWRTLSNLKLESYFKKWLNFALQKKPFIIQNRQLFKVEFRMQIGKFLSTV